MSTPDVVHVGRIAHGGHWVARAADGRVLFVRGAVEGETVRVRVTHEAKRHAFADVVEVLEPSPDRVEAPCPIAASCGGCDFQHVAPAAQSELKRQVVAEQLGRLAGLPWTGAVERIAPLTGWRTRVRYHAADGRWGMHPSRSNDVTPLPAAGCLIAAPGLEQPPFAPDADGATARGVRSTDGPLWGPDAAGLVREHAAGRDWQVWGDGFWQVHPAAAQALVDAVLTGLDPRPDETALDLYCGVGLFAGALASRGVRVTGVEGSKPAVELARTNVPAATFVAGSVEKLLAPPSTGRGRRPRLGLLPERCDLIVLDPPRVGAGASVIDACLKRKPRALAYVACDPAALARDLGHARSRGWHARTVRAFDLFGYTHHVECVAILVPGDTASA